MDFFYIQITDPDLGLLASLTYGNGLERFGWKIRPVSMTISFAFETELCEKAIDAANRLNPVFVVATRNMVSDKDEPAQLAVLRRITGQLGSHIPFRWPAIARDKRQGVLDLLESLGVSAVFSGHRHRNPYLNHKGMQTVTTSAVGYPLGDDPSRLRIVKVFGDRIEHHYYGMDEIPDDVE